MQSKNVNSHDIFECIMCGKCCKGYGGTYISTKDAEKIAMFLNITYEHFISQYTQSSGKQIIIAQQKNDFCVFWNKNRACLIHPVKPEMCRRWPFIKSVLTDISNWKIMANSCPGIKTTVENNKIIACIKNVH